MDDRLKRRLIGAAVLASLAVIFVPMLVEEEPVPVPGSGPGGIPPREDLTFRSQVLKDEITVPTDAAPPGEAEPAPEAAAPVAVAPAPDVTPTTVEPPTEPVPPPVAEVPVEKPAEKPVEPPPEKPQAPAPATARPEPKSPPPVDVAKSAPPEPKAAPAAPSRSGARITTWIVQVGNFSTRAKADAVAKQLRGKGLEVFVEPIGKPASIFRVAVGPEAERGKAEALIPRVEAALPGTGKPFIRSYP